MAVCCLVVGLLGWLIGCLVYIILKHIFIEMSRYHLANDLTAPELEDDQQESVQNLVLKSFYTFINSN